MGLVKAVLVKWELRATIFFTVCSERYLLTLLNLTTFYHSFFSEKALSRLTTFFLCFSGLDLASFAQKVGLQIATPGVASAGTFVVAYAVHKVFAPVRISITLASVPFLVKYLRVRKVNKK